MFKQNSFQNKLFYFCILLFIIQINNGFTNIYIILKNNYENRMVKNAGYCEKQGYGFVKSIYDKYKRNVQVENFEDYASSGAYFYSLEYKSDSNYIIFLNLTKNNFLNKYEKDYKILINENNCYFLKKR